MSLFVCLLLLWAALACLGYEKTCVLFNIGALASQIATEQNLDSDEGLKAAAKNYQVSHAIKRNRLHSRTHISFPRPSSTAHSHYPRQSGTARKKRMCLSAHRLSL